MPAPCHRSPFRSLTALLLVFLAIAAALPGAAQNAPGASPRPLPRPVPGPLPPATKPLAAKPPKAAPLSFAVSTQAEQIPTITAGDPYSESIPVGCSLGATKVDLSVSVNPPAFGATVSPTRVTTPANFTLSAMTLPTTPANEYQLTVTATAVDGPCTSNSTTRLLLVERPVRLEVQPASQTIAAGSGTSYTVTIRRKNFSGPVALRATDLPGDVQASFSPAETSGKTSTLTLNVAAGSTSCPPPAGCDFRIRGRAEVEVQAVPAQLVVRKQVTLQPDATTKSILTGGTATFAIQVKRSGYAGALKLSQELIEEPDHAAVTSSFSPSDFNTAATVSFMVNVGAGGQGRYRFRLMPVLPSPMPDVTLVPVEVTVEATPPRGVDITVTPASISIPAGGSATYQIQIVKFGVPSVRFGINGLPPKAQAIPNQATDPTSVRIVTASDTPARTYSLTVLGVYDEDGKMVSQQANSVDLVVGTPAGGSVDLEADPAVKDIDAGSSRTFPITVRPQGGFRGMVTLGFQPASNSPAVQPSFSPSTVDLSSGNAAVSTLTLAVPAGTSSGGPFPGTVTGFATPTVPVTSATVNYRILSAAQPALSLSLSPTGFNLQTGQSFDLTATVTRLNGCQGQITLLDTVSPFTALGTIDFQPVPGAPDTFRARVTAATVQVQTSTTINVTAIAPGCASASRSITGTVRPKILIPPQTPPDPPSIGGFNPLSGTPGTSVEIVGGNLGNATRVAFNGTPAVFSVAGPNRLFATVPNGATTGKITVSTPAGTATSFNTFAITAGGPVITDLQPRSGQPGFAVTVAGVNLTGATSVAFNGRPAQFTVISGNFIQAFVPDAATTGPVVVTTPSGTATSPVPFEVR